MGDLKYFLDSFDTEKLVRKEYIDIQFNDSNALARGLRAQNYPGQSPVILPLNKMRCYKLLSQLSTFSAVPLQIENST